MKVTKLVVVLLVIMALMVGAASALAAGPACAEDYNVQAADWLSKLADKYLGDVNAYPAILRATNQMAQTDKSYPMIENPDVIEPGWKLCIPSKEDAQKLLPGPGSKQYVLVPKNLGNPYFDAANKGAQVAGMELGVTVTYQGSATADATQEIQLLNALIAQKVSGLAVSANDSDALVPTGKAAIAAGIPVVSWDAPIAPGGRVLHINQATAEGIGRAQIQLASKLAGGKGEIAILSATSTAPNQNEWIKWMNDELTKPEYKDLKLVATVYGDDDDTKSYDEAIGLMKKYPDLKVIISPTTVGIAASGRAVKDADKIGKVQVTGLGLPNQMRDYVKNGSVPAFQLWNVVDLGYLSIYAVDAIASGKIKGVPGDKFSAGKLGEYTVDKDGTILLGPPYTFDKDNIDKFNF